MWRRGFTTLSASLGQMAVAMHEALFHCIRQDGQLQDVACAIRTLTALLAAAPYHRLPDLLLSKAIQVNYHRPCVTLITCPC